jgi:hypothetical protein
MVRDTVLQRVWSPVPNYIPHFHANYHEKVVRERIGHNIFTNLHGFSTPKYEEMIFGMSCVCTCASLAYEQLDGFYSYLVFNSLSILCGCTVNRNI